MKAVLILPVNFITVRSLFYGHLVSEVFVLAVKSEITVNIPYHIISLMIKGSRNYCILLFIVIVHYHIPWRLYYFR